MRVNSIVEAVYSHASSNPQRICLADRTTALTYEQYFHRVLVIAHHLTKAGLKKNDCVAVECTQDVAFSACCLGIQLAGGIFVPVEKGAAASRWGDVLSETDAAFVIGKRCKSLLPEGTPFLSYDEVAVEPEDAAELQVPSFPDPDDVAEVLFSTGTTGKTKGITLTHAGVIAVAENIMYGTEADDGEVELITAPASHSHGLRSHYACLLKGNTVVLIDGVAFANTVFSLMDRYRVTCIDIVPAALKLLLQNSKDKLANYADQLHFVELGTAPMSEEDKEQLRKLLPRTRLYNFYGSTEAGRSCVLDFNCNGDRVGSIGKPTHNSRIQIVDENHNELAVTSKENTGLLAVSGGMMMQGYWRQPELTASVLINGVLYSSDLCYRDADGFLYVTGRNDDVINSGGIKIAPSEIESAALAYPGVDECACVGRKDPLVMNVPVLFVTEKEKDTIDTTALARALATSLDANKRPHEIIVLPALPRTYNGKLDRKVLRAMANGEN